MPTLLEVCAKKGTRKFAMREICLDYEVTKKLVSDRPKNH